jgi:hypothetical protein
MFLNRVLSEFMAWPKKAHLSRLFRDASRAVPEASSGGFNFLLVEMKIRIRTFSIFVA